MMKLLTLLLTIFLFALQGIATSFGEDTVDKDTVSEETVTVVEITPDQARSIAKEAYIYAYPMIYNYKTLYLYTQDKDNPEYKGPINQLVNIARVYTPEDKAIVTPNSDTPYSFIWLDLRAEPIVLTVPEMDEDRYYSVQLIDIYTFNFNYIGSRATGNKAGNYMIAGHDWKGEKPEGVTEVIESDTDLVLAVYRTQLFDPEDIENIKEIQARYKAEPLSKYLGEEKSPSAPDVQYPVFDPEKAEGIEFIDYMNFLLQFSPTPDSEKEMMDRFSKIGIGSGKDFDPSKLSLETRDAIVEGIAEGKAAIDAEAATAESSADYFGTRKSLGENYLIKRAVAAKLGIYGNTKEEAIYPVYLTDGEGKPLDGSKQSYTLTFPEGQLPPAKSFWSVTMYDGQTRLLVDNPIDRYLINSPMLPGLKKDEDGRLIIYIQNESPGKGKETNWLPAPDGPFYVVMRLYWPEKEALDGTWKTPSIKAFNKAP